MNQGDKLLPIRPVQYLYHQRNTFNELIIIIFITVILTIPMSLDKLRCGGPNEVDQGEECYQFDLSNDLSNDSVINQALVLFYAESRVSRHHAPRRGATHQNISIVAKFPTSGEGMLNSQNEEILTLKMWKHAVHYSPKGGITLSGERLRT